MQNKNVWVWRGVLALLLGASTVMTILGAVGTACLAWNGNLYPPQAFGWIVPHMPTYQLLVYVSLGQVSRWQSSRTRSRAPTSGFSSARWFFS